MPYPFVPSTCRYSVSLLCVAAFWFTLLSMGDSAVLAASEQGDLHGSVAGAGIRAFVPGKWGVVRATVSNPTTTDQTYRVMVHFLGRTDRQFMVDVWAPPRSRRQVNWPVRLIEQAYDGKQASVEMRALLLPAGGGGQALHEQPGTLLILNERRLTAMVSDGEDDKEAVAMVAARQDLGLGRRATYTSTADSPQYAVGWDAASVLVLSTDQPDFDSAQRRALRQWIRSGGTLWVWGEQVDPQAMALLLGDAWGIEKIDDVTLNEVTFDEPATVSPHRGNHALGPFEVEKPLRMARVIAPGYETVLSIRGWPAVLERRIGNGRLIVTTVEGRTWLDDSVAGARRRMAMVVFADGPEPGDSLVGRDAAAGFVSQQVGRPVVPRGFIAGALGLLVAVLVVGGLWFGRRGQLERVALLAIGASLVVVIAFQIAGRMQRGNTGPIDVTLQVVRAVPGDDVATITGALGAYAPTRRKLSISSQAGGWAWPQIESGEMQQLISRGLERWTWQAMEVGEGTMRLADYACSTRFDRPLGMDLTFTERGLAGTIDWPTADLPQDMLLATPTGTMLVEPVAVDGHTLRIALDGDNVVSPGTYFAAGMISQIRQQRAVLLDSMFAGKYWPDRPTLLGWTGGVSMPITISGQAMHRDTAVWAVPLTQRPAKPGDSVRVPWPFVPMTVSRSSAALPLFDRYTGRWDPTATSNLATTFIGRFMLPPSVLPLRPTEATLELDISAIKRTVQIVTAQGEKTTDVAVLESPDGPVTVTIPGEALSVDEGGGVQVGFAVGVPKGVDAASAGPSTMWRVRAMRLSVNGVVQQPPSPDEAGG